MGGLNHAASRRPVRGARLEIADELRSMGVAQELADREDVPIRLSPVATTGSGQGFDAVVGAAGTNFLRRFRVPVCCCDSV